MTIIVIILVALVVLVVGTFVILSQIEKRYESLEDSQDLEYKVDELANNYMKHRSQHALVIGVIANQSIKVFGFGKTGEDLVNDSDGDTLFEIASITKLFTTLTLQRIVNEGHATWKDPLEKWLDISMPENVSKITLAQLATHTSGLPRLPKNLMQGENYKKADPYAHYDVTLLEKYLKSAKLKNTPGSRVAYSNLGMGILGHVISLITGKSYFEAVKFYTLEPLEMDDTEEKLPKHSSNLAIPRTKKGKIVSSWNMNSLAGCGVLKSTATDLLKFIEEVIYPDQDLPIGKALTMTRQFLHDSKNSKIKQCSYGWQFTKMIAGDLEVWWHNGGTAGSISYLGIIPDHEVGVICLCNSGDAFAMDHSIDQMGQQILKLATKISWEEN